MDGPEHGFRLLAMLIAADLQAGSPALAEPDETKTAEGPQRGRKRVEVVAIAVDRALKRAA